MPDTSWFQHIVNVTSIDWTYSEQMLLNSLYMVRSSQVDPLNTSTALAWSSWHDDVGMKDMDGAGDAEGGAVSSQYPQLPSQT